MMIVVIGDTVKSKHLKGQAGLEGSVVGLVRADFYMLFYAKAGINPDSMWNPIDPNWREGLIAYVYFQTPTRSATKEEWVESGSSQGYTREDCEASYDKNCPMTNFVAIPVADLEVVG